MSPVRRIAVAALACVLVGCRDSSQQEGPPAEPSPIEEQAQEYVRDLHERADVVFEGTVVSVRPLTLAAPADTIVTSFDPRFLAAIRIDTVLKGDEARQWCGERPFAIHSPARDLGLGVEGGAGRQLRVYLFDRHQDEDGRIRFSSLSGLPVGEGEINFVALT